MKPIYLIIIASVVIVFACGFAFGGKVQSQPQPSNEAHLRDRFMKLCAMQIFPAPFTHQQCEQRARFVFDE